MGTSGKSTIQSHLLSLRGGNLPKGAKNLLEVPAGELEIFDAGPVLTFVANPVLGFELEKTARLLEVENAEESDAVVVSCNVVFTVDLEVVVRVAGVVTGGRSHISRST